MPSRLNDEQIQILQPPLGFLCFNPLTRAVAFAGLALSGMLMSVL